MAMNEYALFNKEPVELFTAFLRARGIDPEISRDDKSYTIAIPADLGDDLEDEIEDKYGELLMLNRDIFMAENEDESLVASIGVKRRDGNLSQAFVDPDVLGKILGVVTADEFDEVVASVVMAVEDPDDRSFCDRVREKRAARDKTS